MTAPDLSVLLLAGLPAGVMLWSFMEYALHRFAFHEAKGRNYGSREHLRHHGSEDTVLESWYLSWAGVLLVGLVAIPMFARLVGLTQVGWGIGIGYVAGYGFYDLVHWRAHRRPIPGGTFGRYERWLRKHHFIHHFHAPLMNHGVTSPLSPDRRTCRLVSTRRHRHGSGAGRDGLGRLTLGGPPSPPCARRCRLHRGPTPRDRRCPDGG